MKKSAKFAEVELNAEEKDEGVSPWITVSSPDDLFKYDVDGNFNELGYQSLLFNVENVSRDIAHFSGDN